MVGPDANVRFALKARKQENANKIRRSEVTLSSGAEASINNRALTAQ